MTLVDFQFKGREPTREYACPVCRVRFKAPNSVGRQGKTCPNGHWTSLYYLNYFDKHGRLAEPRQKKPIAAAAEKPAKPAQRSLVELGFARRAEQSELILQCWQIAYERLLGQLPEGGLRGLVTGAFDRTSQITREVIGAS